MIPYMGGKSTLSKWIISQFPQNYENMLYCEVFGGGGWVMFRKNPSVNEVYNDAFKDLVNLFTVVRDRYRPFKHKVKWTFHSRAMFDDAKKAIIKGNLRDVDRALCYLITKVQSFSSNGSSYAYRLDTRKRNEWTFMLERIEQIRERMKNVNLECMDFEELIRKYDTTDTLFYLDPPYVDKEHYYQVKFGMDDHKRLAKALSKIKGRFSLSYYPHPFVSEAYGRYRILTRETTKQSCGLTKAFKGKERPKATELLIMNY